MMQPIVLRTVLLLLCSSFALNTYGQISWNTSSTGNLRTNVCYGEDTVRVSMNNLSGAIMNSDSFVINLPSGIFYIPNSLVEQSNFSLAVVAANSTNQHLHLVLKSLPAIGGTLNFSFRIRANCDAIDHFEAGNQFRNVYQYYHDNTSEPAHSTPDYNINYPDLSFSSVTNANVNTTLGSTYSQQLMITNGGNGPLTAFYIALNPPSGMQFSGVTNGVLNATNDTIFFEGTSLGADTILSAGESVSTTYQITIANCTDLSTDLHLSWGCDDRVCKLSSYPIAATVPNISPIIETQATPSGIICFDQPNLQQVRLINTGTGLASNAIFEIFSGQTYGIPTTVPNRIFPIDTSSIQIQLGTSGTPISVSPFSVQNGNGAFAANCGAGNQIGRARINLPVMNVGDTIIVSWTQMACCTQICNRSTNFNAWEYRVDYENECQTETYTTNHRRGSVRVYDNISNYSAVESGPTNINDGDTATFVLEYTRSVGLANPSTNGWIEIEAIIPVGLRFSGDLTIFNRFFTCSRTPDALTVIGDTVRARFNNSTLGGCIGGNGSANKAEVHVGLIGDCSQAGAVSGPLNIPVTIYTVLYPSCPNQCRMPVFCRTWTTELQCVEPCPTGGLQFLSFNARRLNIGAPDNNNNGIADPTGSINNNLIRSRTLIAGDTLIMRYEARVDTGTGNPQFEFAYLNTRMLGMTPNNRQFTALTANIEVFDKSTGSVFSCPNSTIIINGTNNFSVDINACTPAAFVFESGDSIAIETMYQFVTKFNGPVLSHDIENDFFVSRIANPVDTSDQFACNNLSDYFKTIGFYHTTCCVSNFNTTGCATQRISKNYYLSIGPCCTNYANGNYFRNEIRQFSFLDTFEFDLPVGYVMDTTLPADFRYIYTGGSTPFTAITPIDPTTNPVRFVLGGFFEPRGGSFPISDEGYYGTVRMYIKPNCEAAPTSRVNYRGYYAGINSSNNFFTDLKGTGDNINHTAADLDLAPITPLVVSTSDTVIWQFRVDNNSNAVAANNSFFHLSSSVGGLTILDVRNLSTNLIITPNPSSGLYELGDLPISSNTVFEVRAVQNACLQDSLMILAGWNCGSYPADINSYPCVLDTAFVKVVNPSSALQIAIVRDTAMADPDSVDICIPVTYEMEFTSAQGSVVSNIQATVPSFPTGLTFVPGSVTYEYPIGNTAQAAPDPTVVGTAHTFDISNYSSNLSSEGLLGTIDADSIGDRKIKVRFQVQTDCDFISGDAFNIDISSSRPCGDPLPDVTYTVAPILIKGTDATPYVTQIRIQSDVIEACGDKHPYFYRVSITNLGPSNTRAIDSILLRLPAGILYQSYDPSNPAFHNAPNVQPNVSLVAGSYNLSWGMPANITPGDSLVFAVRIDAEDIPSVCANNTTEGLSLINTSIFCASTGTNCTTSTPSGRNTANVPVNRPDLTVTMDPNQSYNFRTASNQNAISLVGSINNTGNNVMAGDSLTVEFFCDDDGSGDFSVGDTYIGFYQMDLGLATGASHPFTWVDTFANALCDINNGQNVVANVRSRPLNNPRQCACNYSQRLVQNILLPVDLSHFSGQAQANNCSILLQWGTVAEENLLHYVVERSVDGLAFEAIGQVKAVGSSRVQQHYQWMDEAIRTAGYYYRLKIVEQGGGKRYSDYQYIPAPCAQSEENGLIGLYPNPTNAQLNVKFYQQTKQATTNGELRILDALGRVVLSKNIRLETGMQVFQLNLEELAKGVYTLEISQEAGTSRQQFTKL